MKLVIVFSFMKLCLITCSAYLTNTQTLGRCKVAFQSVVHIAVQELCKAANALVLPVTLGVVKPTSPFSLLTSTSLEVSVSVSRGKCICVSR